jgi:hypothetical protein
VFYTLTRCDPLTDECKPFEQGSGLIPNRDLMVRRRRTTLRTNTSAGANRSFDRVEGAGGSIALEWTRTSAFVNQFEGHARTRIQGALLHRTRSASTLSSALVEGTMFGLRLTEATASGTVATTRSGTITIVRASMEAP